VRIWFVVETDFQLIDEPLFSVDRERSKQPNIYSRLVVDWQERANGTRQPGRRRTTSQARFFMSKFVTPADPFCHKVLCDRLPCNFYKKLQVTEYVYKKMNLVEITRFGMKCALRNLR
jgi:hypothetical protein